MKTLYKKIGTLIVLSCPVTAVYAADNCINTVDADGKKNLKCTEIIYYYNPGEHGGLNLLDYDNVLIETSTIAKITPLQGWGIYGNNSTYDFKNLTISTTGMQADGIITKNGASKITVDNLTVKTTGYSSDGINLGKESSGSVATIKGNTTVTTSSGIGIRANSSQNGTGVNTIIVKGITDVTTSGNGTSQTGYGVYAGNDSTYVANAQSKIDLQGDTIVATTGKKANGVYARGWGYIRLNNTDITVSGTDANGIFSEAYKSSSQPQSYGGVIDLLGNVKVSVLNAGNAIYASGVDAKVASYDSETAQTTSGIYIVTGNIAANKSGTVDLVMVDSSNFTGAANSNQYAADGTIDTVNNGIVNLNISGANSIWNMTDSSVVSNLTLNGSTLKFAEPSDPSDPTAFVTKTLTVAGNYASNNGLLVLNTTLEGDTSVTDKLIVKGDTSGHTDVSITNIGGNGALTAQGIEIVQVDGISAGTFDNSSRIVAGSYDYFVRSGSTIAGANANNWYLISSVYQPPVTPDPDPEPTPDPDPKPEVKPEPITPVQRPEAGSYLANLAAGNTLFMTRLHDRLGETQYTDTLTGEVSVTSMWLRNVGGHNRFHDSSGQLKTTSNRYVMQLGGDLAQWSNNDMDRWHLGIMGGYANNQSRTHSSVTGYSSRGEVDGYSAGLYATWYANNADKSGTYVDSWVLYNWFDNEVKGDGLDREKYKSSGVTASIEGGYSFKLGEDQRASYWLQPKAQVVWMGVSADDHRETNGSMIKDDTDNNIMTRLGLRAYMNGHSQQDDGKNRTFQPFIEANWIHNTENYTVIMNNGRNTQDGTKNIGELKMGVEGQLNAQLNLWGNVAQQIGDNSYSDTQVMLGVKYSF